MGSGLPVQTVSLGDTVLRTETAAIVATGVAMAALYHMYTR